MNGAISPLSRPSAVARASAPAFGTGANVSRNATQLASHRPASSAVCQASKQDGSVISRPVISPDKSIKRANVNKKPPLYRVLLHNDSMNRREYVVATLLKVVDGMPVDEAVNIMQQAHINGVALVLVCQQEEAEEYVSNLRKNGLTSTLEPTSGKGDSSDN